jgi:hypothetical protein
LSTVLPRLQPLAIVDSAGFRLFWTSQARTNWDNGSRDLDGEKPSRNCKERRAMKERLFLKGVGCFARYAILLSCCGSDAAARRVAARVGRVGLDDVPPAGPRQLSLRFQIESLI